MSIRNSVSLLKDHDTATAGSAYKLQGGKQTIQAWLDDDTGNDHAVVVIEVTNDQRAASLTTAEDAAWLTLGTLTVGSLSSDDGVTDGFVNEAPWDFIRANVTSLAYSTVSVGMVDQE